MKTGCLYDPITGEIISIYTGVNEGALEAQKTGANEGLSHVMGFCSFSDYILNGAITARGVVSADFDVTTIAADGVDVATLSTLPIPCAVKVDGVAYAVKRDGVFELTADAVGEYKISVDEIAYLKKEWIINAT